MNEMKSLTLNGKTYDSFRDQTAQEELKHKQPKGNYVKTVNGITPDGNGNVEIEIGTDEIPDYWQSHLDGRVDDIHRAIELAGRNKSAFLFYTDAHWGYGSGVSPKLLKYLWRNTAINKTIFGGDFGNTYEYPDTGKTMDDWMDVMRSWRLAVRDIPNHHSVVGNHDQDVDAISNDKALYGFLFAPEETSDIVRGGDFFYYIDEPNERTRYLYLNTGLCNFSDEQCKFFIDALQSTPDGWHIVAASHIWFVYADTSTPTVGSVPTNIQKVLNLFDAYNARAKGSMTIDTKDNAYDFTNCNAWVEFCIGGHTHVDYSFTSNNGIPVIICQTDSKHLRGSDYTYNDRTTTEASVSAVVADYDSKKINVIRIGRGNSFTIDMDGGETTVSYSITSNLTNVRLSPALTSIEANKPYSATLTATAGTITRVSIGMGGVDITSSAYNASTGEITIAAVTGDVVITATAEASEPAYTNVLDTVGYTANKRFGSDGTERDNAGTYITGWIPVTSGYLYLKNVTMPLDDSVPYGSGYFLYDSNKTKLAGTYLKTGDDTVKEVDASGNNPTKVFINADYYAGVAYVRLSAAKIDDASIITVNEPIE